MPPLSILDLAFVPEGGTPADALRNTLDLAQHAERWGYRRFWLAEHHNMVGIASLLRRGFRLQGCKYEHPPTGRKMAGSLLAGETGS